MPQCVVHVQHPDTCGRITIPCYHAIFIRILIAFIDLRTCPQNVLIWHTLPKTFARSHLTLRWNFCFALLLKSLYYAFKFTLTCPLESNLEQHNSCSCSEDKRQDAFLTPSWQLQQQCAFKGFVKYVARKRDNATSTDHDFEPVLSQSSRQSARLANAVLAWLYNNFDSLLCLIKWGKISNPKYRVREDAGRGWTVAACYNEETCAWA